MYVCMRVCMFYLLESYEWAEYSHLRNNITRLASRASQFVLEDCGHKCIGKVYSLLFAFCVCRTNARGQWTFILDNVLLPELMFVEIFLFPWSTASVGCFSLGIKRTYDMSYYMMSFSHSHSLLSVLVLLPLQVNCSEVKRKMLSRSIALPLQQRQSRGHCQLAHISWFRNRNRATVYQQAILSELCKCMRVMSSFEFVCARFRCRISIKSWIDLKRWQINNPGHGYFCIPRI